MSKTHCECGRVRSWGCGHSKEDERQMRLHRNSLEHRSGACWHFDHMNCKKSDCRLAKQSVDGYIPFVKHADAETYFKQNKDG